MSEVDSETSRKQRRSSRRASILKQYKSPSREALSDLDPNANKEKEAAQKRRKSRHSRRVSFAETYQIKEIEPFTAQGNIPGGAACAVKAATDSINGFQTLLTATIHTEAPLVYTESSEIKNVPMPCNDDGFDPSLYTPANQVPSVEQNQGIPKLYIPKRKFSEKKEDSTIAALISNTQTNILSAPNNNGQLGCQSMNCAPLPDFSQLTMVFQEGDDNMEMTGCVTTAVESNKSVMAMGDFSVAYQNPSFMANATANYHANDKTCMFTNTEDEGKSYAASSKACSVTQGNDRTMMFGSQGEDMEMTKCQTLDRTEEPKSTKLDALSFLSNLKKKRASTDQVGSMQSEGNDTMQEEKKDNKLKASTFLNTLRSKSEKTSEGLSTSQTLPWETTSSNSEPPKLDASNFLKRMKNRTTPNLTNTTSEGNLVFQPVISDTDMEMSKIPSPQKGPSPPKQRCIDHTVRFEDGNTMDFTKCFSKTIQEHTSVPTSHTSDHYGEKTIRFNQGDGDSMEFTKCITTNIQSMSSQNNDHEHTMKFDQDGEICFTGNIQNMLSSTKVGERSLLHLPEKTMRFNDTGANMELTKCLSSNIQAEIGVNAQAVEQSHTTGIVQEGESMEFTKCVTTNIQAMTKTNSEKTILYGNDGDGESMELTKCITANAPDILHVQDKSKLASADHTVRFGDGDGESMEFTECVTTNLQRVINADRSQPTSVDHTMRFGDGDGESMEFTKCVTTNVQDNVHVPDNKSADHTVRFGNGDGESMDFTKCMTTNIQGAPSQNSSVSTLTTEGDDGMKPKKRLFPRRDTMDFFGLGQLSKANMRGNQTLSEPTIRFEEGESMELAKRVAASIRGNQTVSESTVRFGEGESMELTRCVPNNIQNASLYQTNNTQEVPSTRQIQQPEQTKRFSEGENMEFTRCLTTNIQGMFHTDEDKPKTEQPMLMEGETMDLTRCAPSTQQQYPSTEHTIRFDSNATMDMTKCMTQKIELPPTHHSEMDISNVNKTGSDMSMDVTRGVTQQLPTVEPTSTNVTETTRNVTVRFDDAGMDMTRCTTGKIQLASDDGEDSINMDVTCTTENWNKSKKRRVFPRRDTMDLHKFEKLRDESNEFKTNLSNPNIPSEIEALRAASEAEASMLSHDSCGVGAPELTGLEKSTYGAMDVTRTSGNTSTSGSQLNDHVVSPDLKQVSQLGQSTNHTSAASLSMSVSLVNNSSVDGTGCPITQTMEETGSSAKGSSEEVSNGQDLKAAASLSMSVSLVNNSSVNSAECPKTQTMDETGSSVERSSEEVPNERGLKEAEGSIEKSESGAMKRRSEDAERLPSTGLMETSYKKADEESAAARDLSRVSNNDVSNLSRSILNKSGIPFGTSMSNTFMEESLSKRTVADYLDLLGVCSRDDGGLGRARRSTIAPISKMPETEAEKLISRLVVKPKALIYESGCKMMTQKIDQMKAACAKLETFLSTNKPELFKKLDETERKDRVKLIRSVDKEYLNPCHILAKKTYKEWRGQMVSEMTKQLQASEAELQKIVQTAKEGKEKINTSIEEKKRTLGRLEEELAQLEAEVNAAPPLEEQEALNQKIKAQNEENQQKKAALDAVNANIKDLEESKLSYEKKLSDIKQSQQDLGSTKTEQSSREVFRKAQAIYVLLEWRRVLHDTHTVYSFLDGALSLKVQYEMKETSETEESYGRSISKISLKASNKVDCTPCRALAVELVRRAADSSSMLTETKTEHHLPGLLDQISKLSIKAKIIEKEVEKALVFYQATVEENRLEVTFKSGQARAKFTVGFSLDLLKPALVDQWYFEPVIGDVSEEEVTALMQDPTITTSVGTLMESLENLLTQRIPGGKLPDIVTLSRQLYERACALQLSS